MNASTAYEMFVGSITPEEFVKPFGGNIEMAVDQLMTEKWWETDNNGTPDPSDLAGLITEYVSLHLDQPLLEYDFSQSVKNPYVSKL